ncbi:MAG: Fur family transcriptional regulator [Anaerorhabdus sp.]
MSDYKTEQRKVLVDFFKKNKDQLFPAYEIFDAIKSKEKISRSAIYRNLERLVKNGELRRVAVDGQRGYSYQFLGETECERHLHLNCECCGSVVHVNEEITTSVMEAMKIFNMDIKKSIFIGTCRKCQR